MERLRWLSNSNDPTSIIILLKSRNTDTNNLFDYLANFEGSHSQAIIDPFICWVEGSQYKATLTPGYREIYDSGNMSWLAGIKVSGFAYFTYDANAEIEKGLTKPPY